jgi:hypothetical protein
MGDLDPHIYAVRWNNVVESSFFFPELRIGIYIIWGNWIQIGILVRGKCWIQIRIRIKI